MPQPMVPLDLVAGDNGTVLYKTRDNTPADNLYATNGSAAGTRKLHSAIYINALQSAGPRVLFSSLDTSFNTATWSVQNGAARRLARP